MALTCCQTPYAPCCVQLWVPFYPQEEGVYKLLYLRSVAGRQVVSQRAIVSAQQYLINQPGLKTIPAAIHYGRTAIDQFKVWEIEMFIRVDPDFTVPFAAWNAAVAIAKETLVANGRRASPCDHYPHMHHCCWPHRTLLQTMAVLLTRRVRQLQLEPSATCHLTWCHLRVTIALPPQVMQPDL